jgi:HlyD family secretion protein
MIKKVITIIILVAVVGGAVFLFRTKKAQPNYPEGEVDRTNIVKTVTVDAVIDPDVYANISSELPTRIKKIYVHKNERVAKGDKLFDLDKKSIFAQINKAKLAVERAELAEKKARRKWDILKPEERESIKKETEQSRQTLYELYAQADKTTVVSPIDGIVVKQDAREGEVAQGDIMQIINPESLRVEALVPEVDIAKVKEGQKAKIVFDAYPDKVVIGQVSDIDAGSTVKQNSTYFKVVITMSGENDLTILDGMNADVAIEIANKQDVLAVPRKFAKKDGKGYFVYILPTKKKKSSLQRKYFQAGLVGDDFIEIVSDLEAGEKVFLSMEK